MTELSIENPTGSLIKNGDGSWTYWEKSGERKEFDAEGKLTAIVSPQGPKLIFSYDSRGKLPLIGLSPYAVDPGTPREIAQEFRLTRIDEQDASEQATGRWVSFTYDENTGRLTTVTDSAARTVQYVQDGIGNLTQVFLPENETQSYSYEDLNDSHNATTLAHRGCSTCGTGTTINTYDSEDRVIRQERGLHVLSFSYDIPYVQTTVTEETYDDQAQLIHSAASIIEFNAFGNPISETDPLGNQTVQVRDSRMNVTRNEIWEDQGGPELVLVYAEEKTYDAQDNVLTYTEAAGFPEERTTTYAYDEYGRLTSITVPSVVDSQENKVSSFTYDANDNVLTRTEQGYLGDGTAFTYTTTYTYDSNGQLETVDGPRTDVTDLTTYTYDNEGRLASVAQPLNLTTTYTDYTLTGHPQTVTDPNGVATTYTYDSVGRVTSVTVDSDTTSYTYTSTGKIEQITLPRQNTVSYTYDSLDRLTTITDGLGNTINYTYDSTGNRLKEDIKDPQGTLTKTVAFQYDVLGRLYRVNNPDGNYSEHAYGAIGSRISYKDPKGNPLTNFSYDSLNRLIESIQPDDIHTLHGYDAQDNLDSVTDDNGNTTTYVLDDMGRIYQEISPDTGTTTYEHDPAGNVVAKTDARTIRITYQYDALNRLTFIDFPSPEETDIDYTYDTCSNGKGRLCRVVDQAGTTDYTYSAKGELLQEDNLILGVNYTTGYQYDDNGNLEVLTYPSGRTVRYVYGTAEQVTDVFTTAPGGAEQTVASSIFHYPFGGIDSMTYGNGLAHTVGYDLQYRVTSIQTGTIQDLTYIPDPNGNVDFIDDNLDASNDKDFSYDTLNRLEGATGPWGTLSWTYDNVGNRQSYTDPAGTTNYSYFMGTNRLQALTGATSKTFSYNDVGNTETEDTRHFDYNENNRLKQVNDGGVLGDYTYNGHGERVVKAVQGTTTIFFYDQNGTLIGESDGVNFEEYIYIGRTPIARASGQDLFFIHTDHLDTPRVMTDIGGVSVWELEVRPFGDNENITGTATLNLRFPGQYHDDESGMNYNYFRTYRPEFGRYLEADPIGLAGGLELYSYSNNAPTSYTDTLGLKINVRSPTGPMPPSWDRPFPPGSDAAAQVECYWTTFPCTSRGPDNWGFNVDMTCYYGVRYKPGVNRKAPYVRDPTMTIEEHEYGHIKDYREAFDEEKQNEQFQTENFCTPADCERGRGDFDNSNWYKYAGDVQESSNKKRH